MACSGLAAHRVSRVATCNVLLHSLGSLLKPNSKHAHKLKKIHMLVGCFAWLPSCTSLGELVTVVGITFVLASMAVMSTRSSTYASRANDAMFQVISQLRTAREIAVTKRRNVLITFGAPNQIQIAVQTLPGETAPAAMAPVFLNDGVPGGCTFYVYPGLPDTPMGFGNSSALTFAPASGGTS